MLPASAKHLCLLLGLSALTGPCAAQGASPSPPPGVVQSAASERAAQADSTACNDACAVLASKAKSKVFLGKTGNYDYWDAKIAELQPACRVEPESAHDVSVVLKVVKEHGCHFAVKGGGHNQHVGTNNADGGITIDLVRLNHIDLAADKKSVKLGAGLKWLPVYEQLEKEGLYVLGGRVGDVGVAGFLLGGGLNWFTAKEGFGCDSVLEYKIVLPNGDITTASEKSHPDLYKALRGAGHSNFGIVVDFTLETYELPNPAGIWYSSRTFLADKLPAIRVAHQKFLIDTVVSSQSSVGQFQFIGWAAGYGFIEILIQFDTNHKDVNTFPPAFEHYKDIEAVEGGEEFHIFSPSNFSREIDRQNPPGNRNRYSTFSYKPSAELEAKHYDLFKEAVEKLEDVESTHWGLVNQPITHAAIVKGQRRGGNAMGIKPDDGPLVIYQHPWSWKHAADDARVHDIGEKLIAESEAAAKEMGLWHPYKYANYAAEWQDVYEGYGDENLEWLRKVQKKYDPDGVFTNGGLVGGSIKINTNGKKREGDPVRDEL